MTLLLDTGAMLALANRSDPQQRNVERILEHEAGELVLPAPIAAEVDYMLGRRLGQRARRGFISDLAQGQYQVACLELDDYETLRRLDEQYEDLNAGLADLSVVVLARRFRTKRILTFDERDFRALRPLDGGSFVLLPKDEA